MKRAYLEHGQEEMLLATFVLVSVDCEHDGLQERVDLGHGDQPAKVCNVSRL